MPLSEHEQRLLEQMERALYAEDPKLASTLRGSDLRAHQRRRVIVGSLGLLVGLGLLLAGVSIGWPLGVVGFLVMLGLRLVDHQWLAQQLGTGDRWSGRPDQRQDDPDEGREAAPLHGNDGPVRGPLASPPRGQRLLAAGRSRTARLPSSWSRRRRTAPRATRPQRVPGAARRGVDPVQGVRRPRTDAGEHRGRGEGRLAAAGSGSPSEQSRAGGGHVRDQPGGRLGAARVAGPLDAQRQPAQGVGGRRADLGVPPAPAGSSR